ncbi:MAG: flagellar hook-associated protein FlgL [Methylophilales bacterium]|nr:flagellar hook-associated protein FlgL [Methylophilales bacterium]
MRISTSMIYTLGTTSVQGHVSELYKLQNQLSSGKRITTPSDDPLAAARVLEISQAKSTAEQYQVNGAAATSALQSQAATLQSISEVLNDIRTLAVQAGDGALSKNDQLAVATEIEGKYTYLLGLANTSENGKYLFSGFKGETQPFSETSPGVVAYNGDQGSRLIQVSSSRQVPVSSPGVDIFQRIKNGNGDFAVSADPAVTGTVNQGTGVATPGSVLNNTLWNAAGNTKDYKVLFAQDTTIAPPVTTYDIVTNSATTINGVAYAAGTSLLTNAASAATASATGGPRYTRVYTDNAAISFKSLAGDTNPNAWDLGIQFNVSNSPTSTPTTSIPVTAPDVFTVKGSVNNQDIFATIHNLIGALRTTGGAQLANHVMGTLANLTQAEDAVLTADAAVGVIMKEVDSHASANEDAVVQYKTTISGLEDLDYAQASTDLALRQTNLEAAQKSFLTVQALSLFNFIHP